MREKAPSKQKNPPAGPEWCGFARQGGFFDACATFIRGSQRPYDKVRWPLLGAGLLGGKVTDNGKFEFLVVVGFVHQEKPDTEHRESQQSEYQTEH